MQRSAALRLELVEYIPEELAPHVLYVSQKYKTAAHACCCGCGREVVTPLGPTDWQLTVVKGVATLYPSIGNWNSPCRAHYWIRRGRIEWAPQWSEDQIKQGRLQDKRIKENFYNQTKVRSDQQGTLYVSLWAKIVRWFGG